MEAPPGQVSLSLSFLPRESGGRMCMIVNKRRQYYSRREDKISCRGKRHWGDSGRSCFVLLEGHPTTEEQWWSRHDSRYNERRRAKDMARWVVWGRRRGRAIKSRSWNIPQHPVSCSLSSLIQVRDLPSGYSSSFSFLWTLCRHNHLSSLFFFFSKSWNFASIIFSVSYFPFHHWSCSWWGKDMMSRKRERDPCFLIFLPSLIDLHLLPQD